MMPLGVELHKIQELVLNEVKVWFLAGKWMETSSTWKLHIVMMMSSHITWRCSKNAFFIFPYLRKNMSNWVHILHVFRELCLSDENHAKWWWRLGVSSYVALKMHFPHWFCTHLSCDRIGQLLDQFGSLLHQLFKPPSKPCPDKMPSPFQHYPFSDFRMHAFDCSL